ncbi:MAG: hypothetical protein GXP29_13375 [Planctomycetes bacterium]|nr:hypothetical protein [Planctomycetota bacterium]
MILTAFFWMALLFAGAVIVRRVAPEIFEGGPMAVIALGSVAALAVLSPVSILCYLIHLPVMVLSIACILLVLWAIYYATLRGYWKDLRTLMIGAVCIEMGIVAFDMWTGARVGASTGGDASVHLARIRFLLDHGFSNRDPYIEVPAFFSVYNTNIIHALMAACSRICRIDHLGTWVASLAFAKLLTAAGAYFAAWSVFGRRWPAWITCVFVLMTASTITFVIYPNQLCVNWMMPMMLGLVVRACSPSVTRSSIIALAAGAFVLGQVHGLYLAFALLIFGPVVAVVVAFRHFKQLPDRWLVTAALGALLMGAPFSVIAKLASPKPVASKTEPVDDASSSAEKRASEQFIELASGSHMYDPQYVFGRRPALAIAFIIIGVTCSMVGSRRREALIAIGALAVVSVILFVPPVCTLTLKLLGKKWILSRLSSSFAVCMWGILPGSVALLIEPSLSRWWLRGLLSIAMAIAGAQFYARTGAYTWSNYWKSVQKGSFLSDRNLGAFRRNREILTEALPGGSLVLTDRRSGRFLVTIYDCHILSPDRGSPGVASLPQRRIDQETLLAPDTSWDVRKKFLDQYAIRFFLVTRETSKSSGWLNGRVVNQWKYGGGLLVEFHTD